MWNPFKRRSSSPPERPTVEFDDDGVTSRRGAVVEHVRWAELAEVRILTTDDGPLADDVFFVLVAGAGGCMVPQGAGGCDALLRRLQELPGFRNESVIEAMGSTEFREFLCWRRDASADHEVG